MIRSLPHACSAFISYLESLFALSVSDLHAMMSDVHAEMQKGLSGHESSLKMLPSFIDRPGGNEKGAFMALDLGGTNLRVLAVMLDGKRVAAILNTSRFTVPKTVMQGTAEVLFDFIADCIKSFLSEHGLERRKTYDLSFTFSFPVQQTSIAGGMLIVWTKGFTAKGVQGKDVVSLLNQALKRKHIDCIRVRALANDTVGTLAAGGYADPTCDMGVILGTGTNACYREKCSNIKKMEGGGCDGHMIVNMEWGNFDKLRLTYYDRELDASSVNPGAMYLEKMVSGMYLGELTRHVLVDAIKRDILFLNAPHAAVGFKRRGSFRTSHMSLIEGDETGGLDHIDEFLKKKGMTGSTLEDRNLLKRLCGLVSERAAALAATAIASVVTWMDPELKAMHTVGIDGSLFEKYAGFPLKMKEVTRKLYGEKANNIAWFHSKDGSGRGAAIIAAVAAASQGSRK